MIHKPVNELTEEEGPEKVPEGASEDPLPSPPAQFCRNAQDFFDYWANLNEAQRKRSLVYVYRTFPVIDKYHCPQPECGAPIPRPQRGMQNARQRCSVCGWEGKISTNIGKLGTPIRSDEMLEHFGWGDYSLQMKDAGRGKIVTQTHVRTDRDSGFPPLIPDLRDIVLGDPANREYINSLRSKGIRLPGDPERQGEEAMPAQITEVVNSLTDTVDKVLDRNAELTEKVLQQQDRRPEPVAAPGVNEANAAAAMAGAMGRMVDSSIGVLERAANIATTGAAAAGQQQKQTDPIELFNHVANLVERLMPKTQDNTALTDLLKDSIQRANEAERQALQATMARFEDKLERATAAQANPNGAPGPKGFVEQLKEFSEARDSLADLLGMGDSGAGGAARPQSTWERIGDMLIRLIQPAMPIIGSALVNKYMLPGPMGGLGNHVGPVLQPSIPNVPVAELPPVATTSASADPNAHIIRPGQTTTPNAGASSSGATLNMSPQEIQMSLQLAQLAMMALNMELTGDEFAEKLVYKFGQSSYDQVVSVTKDDLLGKIRSIPQAWQMLGGFGEARLEQFLAEFYDWGKEEEKPKLKVKIRKAREAETA